MLKGQGNTKRQLHLIMRKKFYFLVLLWFPFFALAQNTYMTGNIFDNENRSTPIEGVAVRNITSKALVFTGKDGRFAISAKTGDLLSYAVVGYQTDTVYLVNLFPKNIYLRTAVNNLNPVNITTAKVSPFLNTKDPDAVADRQLNYSKDRGGLRLGLGYGKFRRQLAKVQGLEEEDIFQEEIAKNFNIEVVQKLVKYKGADLTDYMDLYRPNISQIKAERPFNYTLYIATTFQEWKELPADAKKLPPLSRKNN